MNISIQNLSNKSILFNPNNVNVLGYSYKRKKINGTEQWVPEEVELELLSYENYDKIVKKKQRWENFWTALGEGLATYSAGYSTSFSTYSGYAHGYSNTLGSSYITGYGQSITHNYNGYAAYAARQQANANYNRYVDNQRQIRQQIGDGYAKKHTIRTETEFSGFFNIKFKKIDVLILEIIIDGERYPFTFNWNFNLEQYKKNRQRHLMLQSQKHGL